jgi:protein-tyrosine phosphatase
MSQYRVSVDLLLGLGDPPLSLEDLAECSIESNRIIVNLPLLRILRERKLVAPYSPFLNFQRMYNFHVPTADIIEPNLYLGDWQNALSFRTWGSTLCVIETHPADRYDGMTYYIPILEHDEDSLAMIPPRALIHKLDEACEIIDDHILNEKDILVHCWAGVERSPLTLAYWLVKSKRQPNLDEAYKFLKSKRPIVEDRRVWLPFLHATSW